jgi:hypothetical protein
MQIHVIEAAIGGQHQDLVASLGVIQFLLCSTLNAATTAVDLR